jgi:hypothetical protein
MTTAGKVIFTIITDNVVPSAFDNNPIRFNKNPKKIIKNKPNA